MKGKKKSKLKVLVLLTVLSWIAHNFFSRSDFLVKNYHLSFSWNSPYILFLNIIFVLILLFWFLKKKEWSLLFIVTGGIVNLSDRLILGYVRDYWNFVFGLTNNLADWLIGIGVLLFFIEVFYERNKNSS